MRLVDEITGVIARLEAAPVAAVDWAEVAGVAARLAALADHRMTEVEARATIAAAVAGVLGRGEELEFIALDAKALADAHIGSGSLPALAELRGLLEEVGAHIRNRPASLNALRAMERELEQLAARANAALAAALQGSAPDLQMEPAPAAARPRDAVQPVPDPDPVSALAQQEAPPADPVPEPVAPEPPWVDTARALDEELGSPQGLLPDHPAGSAPALAEVPTLGAETSGVTPEDRFYEAGIEKLAAGDLPAANVLLTAAVRRPALPVLALLEHVTFAPQPIEVPRTSSRVLEMGIAEIQRVADEWTEADALLACTMTTTLCVIDGLQDAGAPECLQRSREAIRSCPMWLEPFLGYWDATHRPIVALRSFIVDEQTARAAYERARTELEQRIEACRGMHFTFAAGNRFAGHVFPERGGPFGWVDNAIDDESADAPLKLAASVDAIASLDVDRFIEAQCRELGQPAIVAGARSNIGSKLEALREAVLGWRLAADAVRNVGSQSSAFFAKQFRELRQEIAAVKPPPEDRDAESRVVHRCARSMLARARLVIEGRG